VTDPWARPANQPPQGPNSPTGEPPTQQLHPQGSASTQQAPAGPPLTQQAPAGPPPEPPKPPKTGSAFTRFVRDPLSLTLVIVIVAALGLAGLVGGELYARSKGSEVVAQSTQCIVQDGVTVSFGPRPFLLQHLTGHYSGIHITTAGNNLREAKGMKAEIVIDDVTVAHDGTNRGTIGNLNATVTWTSEGMKETIQQAIPLIGSFVNGVTTNPSDGTVELDGMLGSIIAKPAVVNGDISLQVVELTGLGFTLPREAVQPALDAFTSQLVQDYPLGIHADSIEVTDSGVVTRLSAQNATMDAGNGEQGSCFAGV
jgi:hypothetical protein